MSGNLSNLGRRLAKLERQQVDRMIQDKLVNCICRESTIIYAHELEEFEAEKNKPCPAHGVRRMGPICYVEHIGRPSDREKALSDREER